MKIKILEYKLWQSNKVKVQSHNFRNGKWIKNPNWEWHNLVAHQDGRYTAGVVPPIFIKEYEVERNDKPKKRSK